MDTKSGIRKESQTNCSTAWILYRRKELEMDEKYVVFKRDEYQGWERVEEQCAFEWAREDNRRYTPKHHKIGG